MFRKILLTLLAALVIIQFIHPRKNRSEGPQPNYIGHKFHVPADVQTLLKKACTDCHSNNSEYPWYSLIQPVHWWLEGHIKDGKSHLNFDEYTNRNLFYQFHKMEETVEMIDDNSMPLNSYTWIHKDAKLTKEEKSLITGWAHSIMDTMKSIYPPDSLVRPKK